MTEAEKTSWEPSRCEFSRAEITQLMKELRYVFDHVRLVEPEAGQQWTMDEAGCLQKGECRCWTTWHRDSRCTHCISRRAIMQRDRITKFEFVDEGLHHVTAKYVIVDGTPCSIEMICTVPDETMLEGHGRRDIVEAITRHNQRVYTDPLTGAYNRRYLEEMFQGSLAGRGVAIIDADNFKRVNDTYGHGVGDQVLKSVVEAIVSCVRSADAVIRFGGDEFVIVFDGMSENMLPGKLDQIRHRVQEVEFQDIPALRQTVSIGGTFGNGTVMELIGRADKMLYQAKAEGRDHVCIEAAQSAANGKSH